ncbi:MAG: LCP family protein [Anaerovoracaceae bacterium]
MSRAEKKAREKRSFKQWVQGLKTWQKIAILAGTIVVLALLIGGIAVYSYFSGIVDEMHEPTPEDYDLSLVDVDGYINILLLGVDSRDMENIKGTRSDMIMIASINKETNDVKLTSVYRDTYLKMGDTSTYDKITHACVYGGPEMTMKSLNQAMDLNITNYAIVNFKAVADLVDAIGGITVDVQQGEIYQLNKYTKATAKNIGRKNYNLVKEPGVQTLEGVQAVSYGRIRKGVGDDFKRTERMRIVVSKVFEKAKTMPFSDLKKIIDMMVPQVKTNLTMNDILALGIRLPQYNISTGSGWPYKWSTGTINKISYVFPAGLANNTTMLHQEVFGQTDYVPSSTVNAISSEIAARIEAARKANQIEDEKEGESQIDDNITDNENPGGTDPENPGTDPDNPGGTDPADPGTEPVDPGTTDPTDPGTTDPADPGTDTPGTDPTDPGTDNPPAAVDDGGGGGTSQDTRSGEEAA